MEHQTAESAPLIYAELAGHQRTEDWAGQLLMAELLRWAERFNFEFKLEVPEYALRVDRLHVRRYGHFRYGHNGFGLRGEVALNLLYMSGRRPDWQVLGTLLHELLHAWQQAHGKPAKGYYHNRQFRAKALEFGLIVDERGVTEYANDSPFQTLLRLHGVEIPDFEETPPRARRAGDSKLKKWCCGCTNVRVAVSDFQARCLKCGDLFRPAT